MPKLRAPFFFKLRYYKPSAKSQAKNVAHIKYISLRSGVDMGEPNLEEEAGALDHLKYMDERPRSHGLFGHDEGEVDLSVALAEAASNEGFTWRIIVSLREDDAVRLGYTERAAWEKMLRASMNEVVAKMGIRETNLKWYAAFHQEKGHPHCHIIFWEKVPERKSWTPKQSAREIREMRKVFIQHIYADERRRLGQERSALREMLRDKAEAVIQEAASAELELRALLGTVPGIPPKIRSESLFSENQLQYLQKRLSDLARMMPGKGRIALAFMPPEAKQAARDIAEWLMGQPQMYQAVERIQEIAREYSAPYSFQQKYHEQAAQNAREDIRDRIAQIVLKGAAPLTREPDEGKSKPEHENSITMAKAVWKSTWRALERERSKAEAQMELAKQREAWRDKIEHEQEEKNKKRER